MVITIYVRFVFANYTDMGSVCVELRSVFESLAKVESDCSSAKRGGDLGPFGR